MVFALGAYPSFGDIECLVQLLTPETSHVAKDLDEILNAHAITLEDRVLLKLHNFIEDV